MVRVILTLLVGAALCMPAEAQYGCSGSMAAGDYGSSGSAAAGGYGSSGSMASGRVGIFGRFAARREARRASAAVSQQIVNVAVPQSAQFQECAVPQMQYAAPIGAGCTECQQLLQTLQAMPQVTKESPAPKTVQLVKTANPSCECGENCDCVSCQCKREAQKRGLTVACENGVCKLVGKNEVPAELLLDVPEELLLDVPKPAKESALVLASTGLLQ